MEQVTMNDKSPRRSLGDSGKQRKGKIPGRKSHGGDHAADGKASGFDQREAAVVSEGGESKRQARHRIPRPVRASCKKSASFDASSLAEAQPLHHSHDDVTWYVTSPTAETRGTPGTQQADLPTCSETLNASSAGRYRLRRTSSIPTLKGFCRKSAPHHHHRHSSAPRAKCSGPTATATTTTTAAPSKSAPPLFHRSVGLAGSAAGPGDQSSGRNGLKTKHKRSSRQLEASAVDIPPHRDLAREEKEAEKAGDQNTQPPLQVPSRRYYQGEAPAAPRRPSGGGGGGSGGGGVEERSSSDAIRQKGVTGLAEALTCDSAASYEDAARSDPQTQTGNEGTTSFVRNGCNKASAATPTQTPTQTQTQTGACAHRASADSNQEEISEEQRRRLPEPETGLGLYQSADDSAPAFDKRSHDSSCDPVGGHDSLGSRVSGDRPGGARRTSIGDVTVRGNIGPAAQRVAVTCTVPAVFNRPRAQPDTGTGPKDLGGATPLGSTPGTPGDSLRHASPPHSRVQHPSAADLPGSCPVGVAVKDFSQECGPLRLHSSSRVATPLHTAPPSPVRQASPPASPESQPGGPPSPAPEREQERLSAGVTARNFNSGGHNGLPNGVEGPEIEHRAPARGHDIDTARRETLSSRPDVDSPRNPADQNIPSQSTTLTLAASLRADSYSQSRSPAFAAATPAGDSNQNPPGRGRSGPGGIGSGVHRLRKHHQEVSESSSPVPPERGVNKDRKDPASLHGGAEESSWQDSNLDRWGNVQCAGGKTAKLGQRSSSIHREQDSNQGPARRGHSERKAKTGDSALSGAGKRVSCSNRNAERTLTSETSSLATDESERDRGCDVTLQCCDSHAVSVKNDDTGAALSGIKETIPQSGGATTNRRFAARPGSQHAASTNFGEQGGENNDTYEVRSVVGLVSSVEAKRSKQDSNPDCTETSSRPKDLNQECTASTVKDSNTDYSNSGSSYKDSNTDVADDGRSASRRPVSRSALTCIPRQKKSSPSRKERLIDAFVDSRSVTSATSSKPNRRKSHGGVFKDGAACITDKGVCEKESVFGVSGKGLNLGRSGPREVVDLDVKTPSGNDTTTIYLTRIEDTNFLSEEQGDKLGRGYVSGVHIPDNNDVDNKLQSQKKDLNRDPLDTAGTRVIARQPKGHDTTAPAAVFKEHSSADAVGRGATVKAATLTPADGAASKTRKSQLLSPPSRKKGGAASKENVCGRSRDRNRVDKHGGNVSDVNSGDRAAAARTTRSKGVTAAAGATSSRGRNGVPKIQESDVSGLTSHRSSASASKLRVDSMSRKPVDQKASSKAAARTAGGKNNADVTQPSDVTSKAVTLVVTDVARRERRSASPKLKQSKENENRKQRSASPRRSARAGHQGNDGNIPTERPKEKSPSFHKTTFPSLKDAERKGDGARQDSSLSKAKVSSTVEEEGKDLASPEKEKVDSPTKETAEKGQGQKAAKKEVKSTASERWKSAGLRSGSLLQKQASRLPRRSTETLAETKTQSQRATSSATLRSSSSSKTGMTSSAKSKSLSSASSASSARSTSSTSRLGIRKMSSPDSDVSTTSDVSRSSRSSLMSSTSSSRLKSKEFRTTASSKPAQQDSNKPSARGRPAGKVTKQKSATSSCKVPHEPSNLRLKKTLSPSAFSECSISTRDSSVDSRGFEDDSQSVVSNASVRSARSAASSAADSTTTKKVARETAVDRLTSCSSTRAAAKKSAELLQTATTTSSTVRSTGGTKKKLEPPSTSKGTGVSKDRLFDPSQGPRLQVCGASPTLETTPFAGSRVKGKSAAEVTTTEKGKELLAGSANAARQPRKEGSTQSAQNWKKVKAALKLPEAGHKGPSQKNATADSKRGATTSTTLAAKLKPGRSLKEDEAKTRVSRTGVPPRSSDEGPPQQRKGAGGARLIKSDKPRPGVKEPRSAQLSNQARETHDNKQSAALSELSGPTKSIGEEEKEEEGKEKEKEEEETREKRDLSTEEPALEERLDSTLPPPSSGSSHGVSRMTRPDESSGACHAEEVAGPTELHPAFTNTEHLLHTLTPEWGSVESDLINKSEPEFELTPLPSRGEEGEGGGEKEEGEGGGGEMKDEEGKEGVATEKKEEEEREGAEESLSSSQTPAPLFTLAASADVIRREEEEEGGYSRGSSGSPHPATADTELLSSHSLPAPSAVPPSRQRTMVDVESDRAALSGDTPRSAVHASVSGTVSEASALYDNASVSDNNVLGLDSNRSQGEHVSVLDSDARGLDNSVSLDKKASVFDSDVGGLDNSASLDKKVSVLDSDVGGLDNSASLDKKASVLDSDVGGLDNSASLDKSASVLDSDVLELDNSTAADKHASVLDSDVRGLDSQTSLAINSSLVDSNDRGMAVKISGSGINQHSPLSHLPRFSPTADDASSAFSAVQNSREVSPFLSKTDEENSLCVDKEDLNVVKTSNKRDPKGATQGHGERHKAVEVEDAHAVKHASASESDTLNLNPPLLREGRGGDDPRGCRSAPEEEGEDKRVLYEVGATESKSDKCLSAQLEIGESDSQGRGFPTLRSSSFDQKETLTQLLHQSSADTADDFIPLSDKRDDDDNNSDDDNNDDEDSGVGGGGESTRLPAATVAAAGEIDGAMKETKKRGFECAMNAACVVLVRQEEGTGPDSEETNPDTESRVLLLAEPAQREVTGPETKGTGNAFAEQTPFRTGAADDDGDAYADADGDGDAAARTRSGVGAGEVMRQTADEVPAFRDNAGNGSEPCTDAARGLVSPSPDDVLGSESPQQQQQLTRVPQSESAPPPHPLPPSSASPTPSSVGAAVCDGGGGGGAVPKVSRRPASKRTPAAVRRLMTSSQPPLRTSPRPSGPAKQRPKSSPCVISGSVISGTAAQRGSGLRGAASQRSRAPLAAASPSPSATASQAAAMSSQPTAASPAVSSRPKARPALTQLPYRLHPGPPSLLTCPGAPRSREGGSAGGGGAGGRGGGEREGLASVLPADTALPSEEPWTLFPAGNAAATGTACLSEQQDAGEERAKAEVEVEEEEEEEEEEEGVLADIADVSSSSSSSSSSAAVRPVPPGPHHQELLYSGSGGGPATHAHQQLQQPGGVASPPPRCYPYPHYPHPHPHSYPLAVDTSTPPVRAHSATPDMFSTPVGTLSPDVFFTPLGSDPEPEVASSRDLVAALLPFHHDHDDEEEEEDARPDPSLFNGLALSVSPEREFLLLAPGAGAGSGRALGSDSSSSGFGNACRTAGPVGRGAVEFQGHSCGGVLSPARPSLPACERPRGESAKHISRHQLLTLSPSPSSSSSSSSVPSLPPSSSSSSSASLPVATEVSHSLSRHCNATHLSRHRGLQSSEKAATDGGQAWTREGAETDQQQQLQQHRLQQQETCLLPASAESTAAATSSDGPTAPRADHYDTTATTTTTTTTTGSHHPTPSPDSCLSPTDSCSEALSAQFLMEVCDTQADLTQRVYRGHDSMSTSDSSGEMIFSSSSSSSSSSFSAAAHCLDFSKAGGGQGRESRRSSHSVSPDPLLANAGRLQVASVAHRQSPELLLQRSEHVEFVSSHSASPELLDITCRSPTFTSSPSVSPTSRMALSSSSVAVVAVAAAGSCRKTVETYTSVFQVSVSGSQQRHQYDNSVTTSDVIYCSSGGGDSDVTQVIGSGQVGSVFVSRQSGGAGSSAAGLTAAANGLPVGGAVRGEALSSDDVIPMTSQDLCLGVVCASSEEFSRVEDSKELKVHHASSGIVTRDVRETASDVSTTSPKTLTSSKPRDTKGDETRTRVRLSAKKACTVTVKPVSTCVQDLQKMTQEEHPSKAPKKPPQPVTLTSVKDSVIKFETTSRSRLTVSVRTTRGSVSGSGVSSTKRSSSSSPSFRTPVTSSGDDGGRKLASSARTSRSVSTSRKESSASTTRLRSSISKTTENFTATTNTTSTTADVAAPNQITPAASNALGSRPDSTTVAEIPVLSFSSVDPKPGTTEPKLQTGDSKAGEAAKTEAIFNFSKLEERRERAEGDEESTAPRLENGMISEKQPGGKGRDCAIVPGTSQVADKREEALGTSEAGWHAGHSEGLVVVRKTSEETVAEVSERGGGSSDRAGCVLSVQTDANSWSAEELQTRSGARSHGSESPARRGKRLEEEERACTRRLAVAEEWRGDKGEMPSDRDATGHHTGTQPCLAGGRRTAKEAEAEEATTTARETRKPLENVDISRNTTLATRDSKADLSAVREGPEIGTHVHSPSPPLDLPPQHSPIPTTTTTTTTTADAGAREVFGSEGGEPSRPRQGTTTAHVATASAVAAADDYVTPRRQFPRDNNETDPSFPTSQPSRDSGFYNAHPAASAEERCNALLPEEEEKGEEERRSVGRGAREKTNEAAPEARPQAAGTHSQTAAAEQGAPLRQSPTTTTTAEGVGEEGPSPADAEPSVQTSRDSSNTARLALGTAEPSGLHRDGAAPSGDLLESEKVGHGFKAGETSETDGAHSKAKVKRFPAAMAPSHSDVKKPGGRVSQVMQKKTKTPSPPRTKSAAATVNRSGSLKREGSLKKEGSLKTDGPLKREGSLKREDSLKRDGPVKREGSLKREDSLKRDGPLKREGSLKREDSLKRDGPVKREGSLKSKSTKESSSSTLKKTSPASSAKSSTATSTKPTSTPSSTSHKSQTTTTKTSSTKKTSTTPARAAKNAEEARSVKTEKSEDARRLPEREECILDPRGAFPSGGDQEAGTASEGGAQSEVNKADIHHETGEADGKQTTSLSSLAPGDGTEEKKKEEEEKQVDSKHLTSSSDTTSLRTSAEKDAKHKSDKFISQMPDKEVEKLLSGVAGHAVGARPITSRPTIPEALSTAAVASGAALHHNVNTLKVSSRDQKASSDSQTNQRLAAGEDSNTSALDSGSSADGTSDRSEVAQAIGGRGPPDPQLRVLEQFPESRVEEKMIPVSGDKGAVFDTADAKQAGRSCQDRLQKEAVSVPPSESTAAGRETREKQTAAENEKPASQDSETTTTVATATVKQGKDPEAKAESDTSATWRRPQNDNGQSVVAKWKRLVRTSRVTNLKETLTNKLSAPVARGSSVSPPPAPVSPTPPRKYRWAREGGVWRKVYLSDTAAGENLGGEEATSTAGAKAEGSSESVAASSHPTLPSSNRSEVDEETPAGGSPNNNNNINSSSQNDKEDGEIDDPNQPIDFPCVLAMSKRFEQEGERQCHGMTTATRVTCRRTDGAAKRSKEEQTQKIKLVHDRGDVPTGGSTTAVAATTGIVPTAAGLRRKTGENAREETPTETTSALADGASRSLQNSEGERREELEDSRQLRSVTVSADPPVQIHHDHPEEASRATSALSLKPGTRPYCEGDKDGELSDQSHRYQPPGRAANEEGFSIGEQRGSASSLDMFTAGREGQVTPPADRRESAQERQRKEGKDGESAAQRSPGDDYDYEADAGCKVSDGAERDAPDRPSGEPRSEETARLSRAQLSLPQMTTTAETKKTAAASVYDVNDPSGTVLAVSVTSTPTLTPTSLSSQVSSFAPRPSPAGEGRGKGEGAPHSGSLGTIGAETRKEETSGLETGSKAGAADTAPRCADGGARGAADSRCHTRQRRRQEPTAASSTTTTTTTLAAADGDNQADTDTYPTTATTTTTTTTTTTATTTTSRRRIETTSPDSSNSEAGVLPPFQPLRKSGASVSHGRKQSGGGTRVGLSGSDPVPERSADAGAPFPPPPSPTPTATPTPTPPAPTSARHSPGPHDSDRGSDADHIVVLAADAETAAAKELGARVSRAGQFVDSAAVSCPTSSSPYLPGLPHESALTADRGDETAKVYEEDSYRNLPETSGAEVLSSRSARDDGSGKRLPAAQQEAESRPSPPSSSSSSSSFSSSSSPAVAGKARSEPRVQDSPEKVKPNEAPASTVGSRSPVPTRLSEGFKRFQRSRGTPWGQQYVQRGDKVTSPRSKMAASNWQLLVSKVTASAVKEAASGETEETAQQQQQQQQRCSDNSNDSERGNAFPPPEKEVTVSGDDVVSSASASDSHTRLVSDASPENQTEPSTPAPDTKSAERVPKTATLDEGPGHHGPVSNAEEEDNEEDSVTETFGTCTITDAQDSGDLRIETTFSETVFQSRVPARTPTGTPKHSRGTPERSRGTPVASTSAKDDQDTRSAPVLVTEPAGADRVDETLSELSQEGDADLVNSTPSSSSSSSSTSKGGATPKLKRQEARSKINELSREESSSVDEPPCLPSVEEMSETESGVPLPVSSSSSSPPSSLLSSPQRSSRGGTCAKLISVMVWDTHDGDKALRSGARRVFWDLDNKELLAGISEHEEQQQQQQEQQDNLPSDGGPASTQHVSRSLQSTPEKRRDSSRERGDVTTTTTTTSQPRRRRNTRRSLSLPTGALSYGDVKITYRDGHFVTEPVVDVGVEGAPRPSSERPGYDRSVSSSDSSACRRGSGSSSAGGAATVLCGSLLNIGSEEEMREEILSLLERGFSTEDITLLFSRYLDQNSNHLRESRASRSTQSLTAPSLYATQSLPRRLRRREVEAEGEGEGEGPRDSLNRPASVDDVHLWQQLSQSQQSLVVGGEDWAMRRTESFYQAMTSSVVPGGGRRRRRRRGEGGGGEERVRVPRRVGEEKEVEEEEEEEVEEEGEGEGERVTGGARLLRHNSDEARTERSRSHRPGFLQRMLQKRKSFHDKPGGPNGRASKDDATAVAGQHKEARDPAPRKVSIKGIFRRKTSSTSTSSANAEWKSRDSDEPGSPPIATFLNDDDIGAINSLPGSPTSGKTDRRTPSADSQLGQQHTAGSGWKVSHIHSGGGGGRSSSTGSSSGGVCSRSDETYASRGALQQQADAPSSLSLSSSSNGVVLRREPQPLPGGEGGAGGGGRQRVSERYSGEYSYCEFDLESDGRSSLDTLTPRSTSPSGTSSAFTPDEGDAGHLGRTSDVDSTLLATPGSLDVTRVCTDRTPVNSGVAQAGVCAERVGPGSSGLSLGRPGGSRKPSVAKPDADKLSTIVQGEITSSNSNDSGIQHDVTVDSSESLKIPPEIASQLASAVKLRNSPSPKQERPKSDFTVRWADLLEQVKETDVTFRRDGGKLRKRPRPKSDLEEDSAGDEGLDYDSTSSEEGGSCLLTDPSLRPLGSALGGAPGVGALGPGGSSGGLLPTQQYDSLVSLVELRRPANRGRLDTVAIQAAKLAKARRMSTPQPIKTRVEKALPRSHKHVCLVRSHSMPDNLDRLHRKKNYFSLIGSDIQSEYSHNSGGEDSSDESEFSVDYQHEKSLSTRASRVTLVTLDQMIEEENLTYAEALWDHVTMDPDELGFRAGDLIRVTDTTEKHWWYGATEHRDGWFPAAFVRLRVNQDDLEAEMTLRIQEEEEETQRQLLQQTTPAPSQSNKTQLRANVVNEIITAEAEYVKHLRDVIEGYLKQARKRPEMFPVEKVTVIFSNIEVIYDFATKLLADLQAAVNKEQPHLTEFGQCFLNKTQQFEIYSEYCNNHPAACEELRDMYRVKRYRHFFEACRLLQEMTEIPLEGFLLTPVQKICKYHLQLAELLKYTAPDHPDYPHVRSAVEAMKKIAKLVNERKRKMESIETLAEWQMLVDDWEGPDILDDSSELIYSGELNKINANGWSQERYFFLFDHQLVYCKKDLLKKNSFGYKGRINMDQTVIVSIPDGRDVQYNVTVRNALKLHDQERNKWFLMVAKTAQIKQRWLKAFSDERRRVHEDMENNFNIPYHLKQAIVSNLKQKFNSNKSSKGKRKSSRSASMRSSKTNSWVSTNATLPRDPRKSSMTSAQGSTSQQTNKIMNFLLGGKRK